MEDNKNEIEKTSSNLPKAIGNSKEIIPLGEQQEETKQQNKFAMEIVNRKISFIERLLPTKEQKIAIQIKAKFVQQQGEASIERSRMENEFFRQAFKETFDMILRKGKEANRREMADRGAINKAALDSKIGKLTDDYFNEMEQLEEAIYNTKSDNIKERKARMLNKRMDEYEATISILMEQYKKINEEGV